MGQLFRTRSILRNPVGVDTAVIAVLQNAPNQRLDGVSVDGLVVGRGVVVPKGFVFGGETVAVVDGDARFDTVGNLTIVRADRKGAEHIIGVHVPAVHKLQIVTIPICFVGLRVAGKADHIDLRALSGGKGRGCQPGKGQQHSHEQRWSSFENAVFHCL